MKMTDWLIVAFGAGALTYLLRAAPFFLRRKAVGVKGLRFLVFTSLAIAAGIVSKSLIMANGAFETSDLALKLIALGAALSLHMKYRNVLLSLFSGVILGAVLKSVFS